MAEDEQRNFRSDYKLRVVFAGGGTGGHLYPGLALAKALREVAPAVELFFLGTARGIEARVVPAEGYRVVLLPVRGLLRKLSWENLLFPIRLLMSIGKCWWLFRQFQPHLVIGTGGYVSGPALTAARLCGIPRVIQEQNSYPGLVNRRHGNRVDAVFITFEASRKYFPRQQHVYVLGNPVRDGLKDFPRAEAYRMFGFSSALKTVLIFGGSQGARQLNEIVAAVLPDLLRRSDVQLLWIVGPAWYPRWQALENSGNGRLKVLSYVDNMAAVFAITDLAVCRSGASTISELTFCGIPAIYVPFPFATADHQTANAQSVVAAGAGEVIAEKELSARQLVEKISALIAAPEQLQQMAAAARRLAKPNAAADIIEKCLEIVELRG